MKIRLSSRSSKELRNSVSTLGSVTTRCHTAMCKMCRQLISAWLMLFTNLTVTFPVFP